MQANKPYNSTGLRHIFAIVSSQMSTMMEPVNAILKHEPANRRLEISPRDISFLSSLSIIHGLSMVFPYIGIVKYPHWRTYQQPEQRFNPSAERLQTAKIALHFRERPLTTVVTLFFAGSYENFSFRQE